MSGIILVMSCDNLAVTPDQDPLQAPRIPKNFACGRLRLEILAREITPAYHKNYLRP
jgi:hypothetical protein